MTRRSAQRGDFKYEPLPSTPYGYAVLFRYDGKWRPIGTAVKINSKRWDGFASGHHVCPNYGSREQVAYCLNREREVKR